MKPIRMWLALLVVAVVTAVLFLVADDADADGTEVVVTKSPPRVSFDRRPVLRFKSEPGVEFECRVNRRAYRRCESPWRPGKLGKGAHVARIRAKSADPELAAGVAVRRFRIVARKTRFGRLVGGRGLVAVRLGDPASRRKALIVGSVHGDEIQGHRIVARLKKKYRDAKGVDLTVVTTVNPDGVARGTRKNARGVDLNRNFGHRWSGAEPPGSGYHGGPRPFSEPESRAVRKLVSRIRPHVTVWYHQPWGAVLVPCSGKAVVQRRYALLSGMATSCRGAGLPGTAIGWQNKNFRGRAFVVELAAGRLSPAAVRRHARALVAVAK